MRIFLVLLLSIILFGCDSPRPQFEPTGKDDIDQVVKTIFDDKRNYFKDSLPVSIDLKKIIVANLPLDSAQQIGAIPIDWILKVNDSKGFNKKDASYILSQNNTNKNFKLDKRFFSNIELTTTQYKARSIRYCYHISVPIFSSDHKKAYVELDKNCEMCGKGYTFYLEKVEEKWKIVWWTLRWIS
jgi:hypothetical protein